jgi:hypothetical protein
MNLIIVIFFALALMTLLTFLGTLRLIRPLTESAKRYRKYVSRLKRQGVYKGWAIEHKSLVLLDALLHYRAAIILAAVSLGFIPAFATESSAVSFAFNIFAFGFWPACYVAASTLSQQYRAVLDVHQD